MVDAAPEKPATLYRLTTDKNERRRLQAAALALHRPRVSAVARGLVPAQHVNEAIQCGLIGVLIALEKWDGNTSKLDDVSAFWAFARPWVLNEIQKWRDVGVYWRKSPNRGKDPKRAAVRAEALKHRRFESLDEPANADESEESKLDRIPSDLPNSETIAIAKEELAARHYTDLVPETREQGRGTRRRHATDDSRDSVRP